MAVERCSMAAPFPCFLSLAVGTYTAACRCPGHLGHPLSSTSFHPRASAGRRSSRSLASSKPRRGQVVRVIVAELRPLASLMGSPRSGRTPPALPLAVGELHHPEPTISPCSLLWKKAKDRGQEFEEVGGSICKP